VPSRTRWALVSDGSARQLRASLRRFLAAPGGLARKWTPAGQTRRCPKTSWNRTGFGSLAEGEGFEPSSDRNGPKRFSRPSGAIFFASRGSGVNSPRTAFEARACPLRELLRKVFPSVLSKQSRIGALSEKTRCGVWRAIRRSLANRRSYADPPLPRIDRQELAGPRMFGGVPTTRPPTATRPPGSMRAVSDPMR
jgi:hypothetical protein